MKTFTTVSPLLRAGVFLALAGLIAPCGFGQGALTPPGAPAPTQKSLQEIWDKIGAVEAQAATLQTKVITVETQNSLLQRQLGLLVSSTVNFAWLAQTIADVGFTPSLAFGTDGQPAIAFETGSALKIARFDGSGWTVSELPGGRGESAALAFGPDGQPAIAYTGSGGRLNFARFNGTEWSVTVVDGGATGFPSLAYGPNGLPGISYIKYIDDGTAVAFTASSGTAWSSPELMDRGSYTLDNHTSLAFARDGQALIAYRVLNASINFTYGTVKVARRIQDGVPPEVETYWLQDSVANDQTPALYMRTPLAIGPDGHPAVAYADNKNQRIYVARYNGRVWTSGLVGIGSYTATLSFAFGPDGQPVLARSNGRDLLFSRYVGNLDGPAWTSTAVDSAGEIGMYCSLAFGQDGQPAIAYMDYTVAPAKIRFARKGTFGHIP